MSRSEWRLGLTGLLLLAGLALLGHVLRRPASKPCALDGIPLTPRYQVRVQEAQGEERVFCCVRCAELWLERQPTTPRVIRVTDEIGGKEIEASAAHFVRSRVITTPTTGNRIHAFAERAAAERHAQMAHGKLLEGADRPFVEP